MRSCTICRFPNCRAAIVPSLVGSLRVRTDSNQELGRRQHEAADVRLGTAEANPLTSLGDAGCSRAGLAWCPAPCISPGDKAGYACASPGCSCEDGERPAPLFSAQLVLCPSSPHGACARARRRPCSTAHVTLVATLQFGSDVLQRPSETRHTASFGFGSLPRLVCPWKWQCPTKSTVRRPA